MALRNCDLDSIVRSLIEGAQDDAKAIADLAAAKLAECGVGTSPKSSVTKLPRHAGRRNPLIGRPKGSGDVNLRGIIDWIESITPLEPLADGEVAGEDRQAMQAAQESLVVVHATAAARSA